MTSLRVDQVLKGGHIVLPVESDCEMLYGALAWLW